MRRWKAYMASSEADRRHAEAKSLSEQPIPDPPDSEFIGAPWFSDFDRFRAHPERIGHAVTGGVP